MTVTITGTNLHPITYQLPENEPLRPEAALASEKNFTRSSGFRGVICAQHASEEPFIPVFAPDKPRLRPRGERWAALFSSLAAVTMLVGTVVMISLHQAEQAKQKYTPVQQDRSEEITKLESKATIMAANWSQGRPQR